MNNNRQFINLRLWGIVLMVFGSMLFGSIINKGNYAFAADKSKLQPQKAIQAQPASSIDPTHVLAYSKAIGEFYNTPKNDKAKLRAKLQDMQRLAPAFKSTVKAVIRELKANNQWNSVDEFLYKEAAKDKLPAQLMAEVKSAGGPKVLFENMDRFIDEDIKNRLERTAALNEGTIFDSFGFVGTAHAMVSGCNIGAFIAYGAGKLWYFAGGKDYSKNAEYNNYDLCGVY